MGKLIRWLIVSTILSLFFGYLINQHIEDLKINNPEYVENPQILLGWKLALIPFAIPPSATVLYLVYEALIIFGLIDERET